MNYETSVIMFLSSLKSRGRKESTLQRYQYDLSIFVSWIKKRHPLPSQEVFQSFDTNTLFSFLNTLKRDRGASTSNIKRIKGVVINFLQFHGNTSDLKSDVAPPPLTSKNFASDKEIRKLMRTIKSLDGLSEYQASGRIHILNRNILLVRFMLKYGLSIQDIISLSMHDLKLSEGIITPGQTSAFKRAVRLSKKDRELVLDYLNDIPETVRPRQQSDDPLFVAFDFGPQTFRWNYEKDAPAALTKISVQRMLQKEIKRADIHVTPTTLRNRWILNALQKGMTPVEIKLHLGLKSIEALHRYIVFWEGLGAQPKYGT
ncbi:tyrosine-type recombinase/integrase [Bacillus cereus]|uniref:tyrosine-type recombinase/integrase n=1 Tax=Bacillus cereus TaxID=1396 RepID=UPI0011A03344|nr:site-specific integrase [Bacillus cereus]